MESASEVQPDSNVPSLMKAKPLEETMAMTMALAADVALATAMHLALAQAMPSRLGVLGQETSTKTNLVLNSAFLIGWFRRLCFG